MRSQTFSTSPQLIPYRPVSEASEDDANAAVGAAKAAFPAWSALSPSERGAYFKKLAALILESHAELAELEAMSMGRPVSAYFESSVAAETFNHYAESGHQALGTSSLNTPGFVNITMRQPYGVVAAIIPWNVPILFLANKAAPALIAGNTVVVKSSEKAPLTVSGTLVSCNDYAEYSISCSRRRLPLWWRKQGSLPASLTLSLVTAISLGMCYLIIWTFES